MISHEMHDVEISLALRFFRLFDDRQQRAVVRDSHAIELIACGKKDAFFRRDRRHFLR